MRNLFIDRIAPFLLLTILNVLTFFGEVYIIGFSVEATLIIRGTTLILDWLLTKPYVLIRSKLMIYFGCNFPKSPLFVSYLAYSFGLFIFLFVHLIRLLILFAFDMVTIDSMIKSLVASILLIFMFAWIVDLATKKVRMYFDRK